MFTNRHRSIELQLHKILKLRKIIDFVFLFLSSIADVEKLLQCTLYRKKAERIKKGSKKVPSRAF